MRKIVNNENEIGNDKACCLSPDDRLFLDALKDYHRKKKYKYMEDWLKGRNMEDANAVAKSN